VKGKLILSASVLALAACGKSDEQTITVKDDDGSTATATVDTKDEKVTIKTNEGNMTMELNGSAKFSNAAPQYPGSKITNSMQSRSDGKSSNMVEMETNDSPADVLAFYRAKMTEAKRPIAGETTSPAGGMIMSGGDKDGLMITVERKNDKTVALIIMSKGY
jgi:hypothetical protein